MLGIRQHFNSNFLEDGATAVELLSHRFGLQQKPVSEQAINKGRQKRLAALGMHEDNTGNNNNNNNLKEPLLQDRKWWQIDDEQTKLC